MEWLFEPFTLILLVALAAVGVAAGVIRRQSPIGIFFVVVGVVTAMIGIRWAIEIGGGAEMAAGLTAGGAIIWTTAVERERARSRERDVGSTGAA